MQIAIMLHLNWFRLKPELIEEMCYAGKWLNKPTRNSRKDSSELFCLHKHNEEVGSLSFRMIFAFSIWIVWVFPGYFRKLRKVLLYSYIFTPAYITENVWYYHLKFIDMCLG